MTTRTAILTLISSLVAMESATLAGYAITPMAKDAGLLYQDSIAQNAAFVPILSAADVAIIRAQDMELQAIERQKRPELLAAAQKRREEELWEKGETIRVVVDDEENMGTDRKTRRLALETMANNADRVPLRRFYEILDEDEPSPLADLKLKAENDFKTEPLMELDGRVWKLKAENAVEGMPLPMEAANVPASPCCHKEVKPACATPTPTTTAIVVPSTAVATATAVIPGDDYVEDEQMTIEDEDEDMPTSITSTTKTSSGGVAFHGIDLEMGATLAACLAAVLFI